MNLDLNYGYEGPQAVPARPSGKGWVSVVETFGGGKGKMKCGARREVASGLTAYARDFEFCYKFGGGQHWVQFRC
jgi:hypothetical protein